VNDDLAVDVVLQVLVVELVGEAGPSSLPGYELANPS
jgi:hypothetical protein